MPTIFCSFLGVASFQEEVEIEFVSSNLGFLQEVVARTVEGDAKDFGINSLLLLTILLGFTFSLKLLTRFVETDTLDKPTS